jgi:hypothetical protein
MPHNNDNIPVEGATYRRFVACCVLPEAEGACRLRALPRCLRCGHDGDGRCSGALFGARAGVVGHPTGWGRRNTEPANVAGFDGSQPRARG